jgi:hypothetical protein
VVAATVGSASRGILARLAPQVGRCVWVVGSALLFPCGGCPFLLRPMLVSSCLQPDGLTTECAPG